MKYKFALMSILIVLASTISGVCLAGDQSMDEDSDEMTEQSVNEATLNDNSEEDPSPDEDE